MLKREPPKIDPNGINYVDEEELDPAKTAVRTSGAPLAKAKKVTPAKVGEISAYQQILLNLMITFSTQGVKECSVRAFKAR